MSKDLIVGIITSWNYENDEGEIKVGNEIYSFLGSEIIGYTSPDVGMTVSFYDIAGWGYEVFIGSINDRTKFIWSEINFKDAVEGLNQ